MSHKTTICKKQSQSLLTRVIEPADDRIQYSYIHHVRSRRTGSRVLSPCALLAAQFRHPPTKSTTRLTTVKIKKDDQGFFTTDVHVEKVKSGKTSPAEVVGSEESLQLLPPFLQEPTPRRRARASRTRELVDRLRSNQTEATPSSAGFEDAANESNLNTGFALDLCLVVNQLL